MSCRHRAFTLIELLMVIVVLALLIGIMVPTVSMALRGARKVTCLSNMDQIGKLQQMYLNDHQERFPEARYMPEPFVSTTNLPSWPVVLNVQQGSGPGSWAKVFHCPGDRGYVFDLCGTSYQYEPMISGLKLSELPWGDKVPPAQILVSRDFDNGEFDVTTKSEPIVVPPFHKERNLLFADGHAGKFE